jgi:hypothetical protein
MEIVVAVLLAAGCATLGAVATKRFWRRRASRKAEQSLLPSEPAGLRELEDLQPDDVLLHEDADLVVTGVACLRERDSAWTECRLEDADREYWVRVDPADGEGAVVGRRTCSPTLARVPSDSIDHEGKIYRLAKAGQAWVTATGRLGDGLPLGDCWYWDYTRPGADRLWIRRGGIEGPFSCFVGQRVARHLLSILPGS